MTDDEPPRGSRAMARGLLTGVSELIGGDPSMAGREFDRVMDRLGKDDVTEEVFEGYALGETVNQVRRRMQEAPGPSVTWREIEDDGEFVGLRVFVSEPTEHVEVYVSTSGVLIDTAAGVVRQPLRFRPNPEVEWVSDDDSTIAEVVVRPIGYDPEDEEPLALPEGDEDGDD